MEDNIKRIQSKYEDLLNKEYKFSLIDEVKSLRDYCFRINVLKYYFLCGCLISDIYLEHNNLDEALKILLEDYKIVNKKENKDEFLLILDRILYVYISKNNYKLACRYANEKYYYIDKENIEVLNRWYLEMSYIYASLSELSKSEECLKEILKNPSDEILPYVLSNLTKIYIDLKDINRAEKYLNDCIRVTKDKEGLVYTDYLLAKLSLLKGERKEALQLYKSIFDNEDINQMTLPIVNEYLGLLLEDKEYEKMGLVIQKIALFINASDDLRIKRDFVKYKIKYLIGINSISDLNNILNEYEDIENQIEKSEKTIILDQMESEKEVAITENVNEVINNVNTISNIIKNENSNLRDLIMSYNKSLNSIINFDESTFVLLNKTSKLDYLQDDNILVMNYKKTRLYEKKVSYNALKDTLVEKLINNDNKTINVDFGLNDQDIINIFNNKNYKDDLFKYLVIIPCIYNNDTFACMIYLSKKENLTTFNNNVLLNVSTKLLEKSLVSVFIEENLDITNKTLDSVVNTNELGMVRIANDTIYFSNTLKNYFNLKHNFASYDNYKKLISKSDSDLYNQTADLSKPYKVEYKLNLPDKTVSVIEDMNPYFDSNNTLLFNYGTIKINEIKEKGLIDGESSLNERIYELKRKANSIEFKYSLIRIKADIKEYSLIYNVFGVSPYYVDDNFIVILENECNMHTLEKLLSNIRFDYSVVRYPRDIVNVSESFNLSKACLDFNYKFFNEEVYKKYLRKKSINKVANTFIESYMPIKLISYSSYDDNAWFEAYLSLNNEQDNIRDLLDDNIQFVYDTKLYQELVDKNFTQNVFLPMKNSAIKKFCDSNLFASSLKNIHIVVYEDNYLLKEVINKLCALNVSTIIDSKIIDSVTAYAFDSKAIKAIMIGKGVNELDRSNALRLASLFKLDCISSYKFNDYNKNIYKADTQVREIK